MGERICTFWSIQRCGFILILAYIVWSCRVHLVADALISISLLSLSCFTDFELLDPISVSFFSSCSPFFAALIGNTVIHLDKALARIREYERMKLKAEFNPCNASSAGGSEVSNAAHPSANPADQVEGTQPYKAA